MIINTPSKQKKTGLKAPTTLPLFMTTRFNAKTSTFLKESASQRVHFSVFRNRHKKSHSVPAYKNPNYGMLSEFQRGFVCCAFRGGVDWEFYVVETTLDVFCIEFSSIRGKGNLMSNCLNCPCNTGEGLFNNCSYGAKLNHSSSQHWELYSLFTWLIRHTSSTSIIHVTNVVVCVTA